MIKNENKLIIVAHASTGSGHTVAAKAIFESLKNTCLNAEVRIVDILDYFNDNNSGEKFVSFTSGAFAPIFDITWRKNFTGKILWGGGIFWPSFLYKKFEDYLLSENPDVVVCTHQVCANSAAKARLKANKQFSIISIPTDYETEGLWPHKQTDLFCVANKSMALTLQARKVPTNKILISGLPVSNKFENFKDKQIAREKFGLPKNKKIALVIAGANESGPYKNFRKTLNDCIKFFANMDWMHFVFCVGKDGDYASKLIKKANRYSAKNFTIKTYTEDLAELMFASDIALIKPGGLVVTECASAGLPILLIGKAYAQENINRRYLVFEDAAEHATTYKGVINLLCDIFTDEKRYLALKNNLVQISEKPASKLIAEAVSKILNKEDNYYQSYPKFSLYLGNQPAHTR